MRNLNAKAPRLGGWLIPVALGSLEAVQDFFPEFQQQRFDFLWRPESLPAFR
jgi:hypothetical protein